MSTGQSDLYDVTVQVHHKTEKGIKVSDTGIVDDAVWLPLSQIEVEDKKDGLVVITAPVWLLREKGLI